MPLENKQRQKGPILFLVSLIAFILSLWVFIYLLGASTVTPEQAQAATYSKDQVLTATNLERKKAGLPELINNPKLEEAAQSKANHMAANKYFSHVDKNTGKRWSDFIKESGYDYVVAGENLANGFYSVNDMVEAWMDSPTHRENILNSAVDETGIGISFGELDGNPTIFVVQDFGKQ